MLNKKIPLYYLIAAVLIVRLYYVSVIHELSAEAPAPSKLASSFAENDVDCNMKIARMEGYKYIHPLIYAEKTCESPALQAVKQTVEQQLAEFKSRGDLQSASVYLRVFNGGNWMAVNDEKKFSIGSLIRIPQLITFFKQEEKQPGFLTTRVCYEKQVSVRDFGMHCTEHIQLGHEYTLLELIRRMIVYSDEQAAALLEPFLDSVLFQKVFQDLHLPDPGSDQRDFLISARDCSVFLKVLYNASYLNTTHSEICTEMLAQRTSRLGIPSSLPNHCRVAHYLGITRDGKQQQLSESALIFISGKAYLLTIMAQGDESDQLATLFSSISKNVYQSLSGMLM